jgi:hypothetical protein
MAIMLIDIRVAQYYSLQSRTSMQLALPTTLLEARCESDNPGDTRRSYSFSRRFLFLSKRKTRILMHPTIPSPVLYSTRRPGNSRFATDAIFDDRVFKDT